jgi:hypothetical protein
MIYEALFEGCRIETRPPHVPKGKHGSGTAILAPKIKERWSFLLTCRLIHTEALPILARSSVLEVSLERTISGLSKTFRRDYLQHIQHVVLAQTSVSLPLRLLPNLRQVTVKDQFFASTAVDVYVRKHDLVEMVPYIVGDHDVDYVGRWIDTLEKMSNGTLTAWDPRGRQTVATWNRLQGLDSSVRIVVSTWIHFQLYNAASDSFRGTSVVSVRGPRCRTCVLIRKNSHSISTSGHARCSREVNGREDRCQKPRTKHRYSTTCATCLDVDCRPRPNNSWNN